MTFSQSLERTHKSGGVPTLQTDEFRFWEMHGSGKLGGPKSQPAFQLC